MDGQTTAADKAKIDEIDAKILKILLSESRTSFTDIAAQCEITVTAVRMRYKRLWKEGVITGEVMLVDPHCLGYQHIVDLCVSNAAEDEKEVTEFLETKPYIAGLVGPWGNYNFFGKVALKDLKKLHHIIDEFEANHKIKHVDALIWARAANIEYPQNLVLKPLEENNRVDVKAALRSHQQEKPIAQLDEIDKKIAKILATNSRTPFKQIAAELDISSKTVIQRYKKLRENLFTLSTITIDLSKIGYKALANLYIKVSNRSKMNEIYAQLLEIPNLVVILRLIGAYDLYCGLFLENFEQMFTANEKIRKIKGVESINVHLTKVPNAWPLNLFPSLIDNEAIVPKYWK